MPIRILLAMQMVTASIVLVGSCKIDEDLVARKQAELAQGAEAEKAREQAAAEPVRAFLASRLNMDAETAAGLEVVVIGDWARATDQRGMHFFCRHVEGHWTLVSAGTGKRAPEDVPAGLIIP